MKKILLLLVISIGLIGLVYYELQNDKATAATAEAEKAAILDAELKIFEDELKLKLALQAKLAADKATAAASTAAYQDSLLDAEFASLEAQLEAERLAQEMMTEIEREMALAAFLQKLADEKAAAAASTAAYQASLEVKEVVEVVEVVGGEQCKPASNLSESNIELFKSALADGSLFNIGPQGINGTEFSADRWDVYGKCFSNYVNPF